MQALILAGGLGKRLRSIVKDRPKPMTRVGEKPFLEYQLEFLKRHRIFRLILCVGYRYQQIQDYFGDGSRWGIHINYAIEVEPLGTAGAIKNAEDLIDGTFLTLNGDTYFDIDLGAFIEYHELSTATNERYVGSMALARVEDARGFGSVQIDHKDHIVSFMEKQEGDSNHRHLSNLVNAGIYALEPEILNLVQIGKKVSLERETFPAVLETGHILGGFQTEGEFIDIGTPEGYFKFKDYVEGRK